MMMDMALEVRLMSAKAHLSLITIGWLTMRDWGHNKTNNVVDGKISAAEFRRLLIQVLAYCSLYMP